MDESFRIRKVGAYEQPLPKISAHIFQQDPLVAEHDEDVGIAEIELDGEACLGHGPTSSRVVVVDYNADLDIVFPPAELASDGKHFKVGRKKPVDDIHFRQVNVWAVITHTLNMIESEKFLGRQVPWRSGTGRLIVVPHAGFYENAYYDRDAGAVLFYYFEGQDKNKTPIYSCLSHDIISHELGHAILDGLKPYYWDGYSTPQTAGFHEFFADAMALTATMQHRRLMVKIVKPEGSNLSAPTIISNLAAEFGKGRPEKNTALSKQFLRTARNKRSFRHRTKDWDAYDYSEVLTGAYYDLFLAAHKIARPQVEKDAEKNNWKDGTPKEKKRKQEGIRVATAMRAAKVAGHMMLRAIDYCPPVDLNFLDFARAVVKADEIAYPRDSRGYRKAVRKVFLRRGIGTTDADLDAKLELKNSDFRGLDIDRISASRTDAYYFIDANRGILDVPATANLEIVHVYRTRKMSAGRYRPPREVVVEFVWPEVITLTGERFGDFQGESFPFWCGGTLVMNADGNVLHYVLKANTPERRTDFLDYHQYLIENDYFTKDDDDQGLGARRGTRLGAGSIDRRAQLHQAAARNHRHRKHADEQ